MPAENDEDAKAGGGTRATMTPLFFSRRDLQAAWEASVGVAPKEALAEVQVTDLRTLAYQMQYDTTQQWRSILLVAPEASIAHVLAQQQEQ